MKQLLIVFAFIFTTSILAQSDFNKLDENGKKNGVWKGVYEESKRPRYEGTFEHGKEIGLFTYFEPEVDWIGYPPQFTDIAVNFKK